MTPLRQQMINIMTYRNFSLKTHEVYLGWVFCLAKHYRRAPEEISETEIEQWLMHLVLKQHLAPASVRQAANGVTFLYRQVLKREDFLVKISLPKRPQKIPALLTPQEVHDIIQSSRNQKYYALLSLCYGCGLRLSEVVAVQINAINSTSLRLKIVQGTNSRLFRRRQERPNYSLTQKCLGYLTSILALLPSDNLSFQWSGSGKTHES